MLNSKNLVSKEGALGVVRIAAYFYKKLKKPHVHETDISSSVDKILQDELQVVTYRVLGYLLLGIVRIYSKKVEYLLDDCHEVLLGINNFVVHARENLPAETQRAPYFSITLPECFELDSFDLEVLDDNIEGNVVPLEQITLKDSMLENASTKQHGFDMCLYEDVAGSYYPCSAKYTPFDDVLSSYGIDVNLRKLLNIDGLTTTLETIQENRFSQRECTDLIVSNAVEEPSQNADKPLDEDHHDNAEKIKGHGSSSEHGIQAEASIEKLQDSDENGVNLVRSSGIEGEPTDRVKQRGEDCQIDREQIMVSEPEQLANEVSPSNLQAEMEKLRDDMRSTGEQLIDLDMLCGDKEPLEIVKSFIEVNHKDGQPRLHEIPEYRESHETIGEDNSISTKPDRTTDIKIPDASGAITPRFMGIQTPAPKERARISRKRTCVYDETIILPNEVMKQSIHNASDLVSKRRKVASTALPVWKASLSFPCVFFEPSIATGISPELRSLYHGKRLKVVKSTKAVVPPKALDILKITTSGILEKIGIAPETSIQSSAGISEQINIAPETPVQSSAGISEQMGIAPDTPVQNPTTANPFECPMSPATPNYHSIRLPLFESPRRDPSPSRDEELDLNQMDEVTNSCSEDTDEWSEWSGRTRTVAKYLQRSFLNQKERAEEEMLNLSRIVEGRTKKESARFFYEILVLSSRGCVCVKQDGGYADILVKKLQKLDQTCGADDIITYC